MGDDVQATSGESAQEYVPITEASDADIDSFLSQPESVASESEQTQEQPDSQEEVATEEVAAQETEEGDSNRPVSRKEYEELLERLEKSQKQNRDQKSFIDRQANELGLLRRQVAERIQARAERIRSGQLTEDQEFEERTAIVREKEALEDLGHQEQALQFYRTNYETVVSHLGEGPLPVEDMAEIFREDGVPEEGIQAFKQNPLSVPAVGLIQAAKRAKERTALKEIFGIAKRLHEENKQLKQKPKQVVRNLNAALNAGPSITGSTSGGVSTDRINVKDVSSLSDADLDALLNSNR